MKKAYKTLAAAAMLCLLLLCGCGADFDPAAYVKGGLDVLYLGEVSEEYLELVVDTREECLAMYEENVLNEAENFGETFFVGVNDEPDEALRDFFRAVFAKSSYEVGEVTETETGYTVAVKISPIDIFTVSYEALEEHDRDFTRRFADGEFEELSGGEIEKLYLQGMIDILSSALDNCGYLDSVTVSLRLEKDEGGVFTVNSEDYAEFHSHIIAY